MCSLGVAAAENAISSYTSNMLTYFSTHGTVKRDDLWIRLLKERWTRAAAAFFALTHKHEDVSYDAVEVLLNSMGLHGNDIGTLRFFTTALVGSPRRNILAAIAEDRTKV